MSAINGWNNIGSIGTINGAAGAFVLGPTGPTGIPGPVGVPGIIRPALSINASFDYSSSDPTEALQFLEWCVEHGIKKVSYTCEYEYNWIVKGECPFDIAAEMKLRWKVGEA